MLSPRDDAELGDRSDSRGWGGWGELGDDPRADPFDAPLRDFQNAQFLSLRGL